MSTYNNSELLHELLMDFVGAYESFDELPEATKIAEEKILSNYLPKADLVEYLDRLYQSRSKDLDNICKHVLFQFEDNPRQQRLIGIGRIGAHNELLDEIIKYVNSPKN